MSFFKSTLYFLIFLVSSKLLSQDYKKLSMLYYKNTLQENITFLKNKIEKSKVENLAITLLDKYSKAENMTSDYDKNVESLKRSFKYDYPEPKNSNSCKKFNSYKKRFESEESRAKNLRILVNTAKITLNMCKNNIYNKNGCTQQTNNYNSQVRLYNQAVSNSESSHNMAENYQESCNRYINLYKKEFELVNSKIVKLHRNYVTDHKKLSNEIYTLDLKLRNILNN